MNVKRYDFGSISLHWVHAVLIAALFVLAFLIHELPKGEQRSLVIGLHKSLGLCAFALVLLRLWWVRRHLAPVDHRLSVLQRRLARFGHRLMYVLLVLMPLSGYLRVSFNEYPLRFFGILVPKVGWVDKQINELFAAIHGSLAALLVLMIVFHVAAVVLHRVQGVPVLARMLPGSSRIE